MFEIWRRTERGSSAVFQLSLIFLTRVTVILLPPYRKHFNVGPHFMRLAIFIALILLSNLSFGQNLEKQKAAIDTEVERISKQSKSPALSFSIQAMKKRLHYVRYNYVVNKSGYVKISRQFSNENDTIQQTFYLKSGKLIHATETITSYFQEKGKTDSITWSGGFYFENGKLIDHITLGHGKSELEIWNPEKEMLTAFDEPKKI